MTYFSYFPTTQYATNQQNVEFLNVKNILLRAKINEYLKESGGISSTYFVKEGERPDTISHKIYGRSDLHWLILLANEIHNPYFDWPMSSSQLEAHTDKKYPGIAVYLRTTDLLIEGGESVYYTDTDTGDAEYELLGTVHKWDPTYLKLEVSGSTDILTNGRIRIGEDGDPIGVFRSELNKYSVHHFEYQGLEIASFASTSFVDQVGLPNQPERTPIIQSYASQGSTPEVASLLIDNYSYEQRRNDGNREIRYIRREFIDTIHRLMRDAFKVE